MTSETEILAGLAQPVRSVRLMVLEKAIAAGTSPELLRALQERSDLEADEECRQLLRYAIDAVRARISGSTPARAGMGAARSGHPSPPTSRPDGAPSGSSPPAGGAVDSAKAPSPAPSLPSVPVEAGSEAAVTDENWSRLTPPERLAFLRSLRRAEVGSLVALAPGWLRAESDFVVATALIRVFGPSWPTADLQDLRERLRSRRSIEALSALEVLIHRDPDSLRQDLPRLLMADDPGARALAVKGLARIDLDEAVAHFEAMLQADGREVRRQALKVAISLPFERVKPGLCGRLAQEADPGLFDEILLLLEINPDLEIPYRLFELAEGAPPDRQARLLAAVRQSCVSLRASGLMAGDFEAAMARLQTWIGERRAARFVRQCVAALAAGEPGHPPEPDLVARVAATLRQPEVEGAFAGALGGPLPEADRQRLRSLLDLARGMAQAGPPALGKESQSPAPVAIPTPATPDPTPVVTKAPEPGPEAEMRAIAGLALAGDLDPATEITPRLRAAIGSGRADLAATAVRTAVRLGNRDLVPVVEPLLASRDPALVAAAIEYLARFGPDAVFPLLGRFLVAPHRRVKQAALDALRRADPAQAVSRLRTLLSERNPQQQEAALGCLVQFDFALVRRLLAEFLRTGPDPRLFGLGLDIFSAYPDPENLDLLFELSRTCPPDRETAVAKVLAFTEESLLRLGLLKSEDLPRRRADREKSWQDREVRRRAPPPPYSVRALPTSPTPTALDLWRTIRDRLDWRFTAGLGIMALALAAGIWWFLQEPLTSGGPPRGRAVLQQRVRIQATLLALDGEVEERRARLRTGDGQEWSLLEQGSSRLSGFPIGSRLLLEVTPFRIAGDGVVQGYLLDCSPAPSR